MGNLSHVKFIGIIHVCKLINNYHFIIAKLNPIGGLAANVRCDYVMPQRLMSGSKIRFGIKSVKT